MRSQIGAAKQSLGRLVGGRRSSAPAGNPSSPRNPFSPRSNRSSSVSHIPPLSSYLEDAKLLGKFAQYLAANSVAQLGLLQLLAHAQRYIALRELDGAEEEEARMQFIGRWLYTPRPGVPYDDVLAVVPSGTQLRWNSIHTELLSARGHQLLTELKTAAGLPASDLRLSFHAMQGLMATALSSLSEPDAWPRYVRAMGDALQHVCTPADQLRRKWPSENYRALEGDSLDSVASDCDMPLEDLCQLNALKPGASTHSALVCGLRAGSRCQAKGGHCAHSPERLSSGDGQVSKN